MAPLIIVSGPSGSGKSTLLRRLLREQCWPMRLSVSATTRPPRAKERPGVDYYFLNAADFEKKKDSAAFLEWALVHDNYYGTLASEVTPYREQGIGVLLDIDVQGAAQVRLRCPDAFSIFIRTADLATLEGRLRARRTESEEALQGRLANARIELAQAKTYDHELINDDLEAAFARLCALVRPLFERGKHA